MKYEDRGSNYRAEGPVNNKATEKTVSSNNAILSVVDQCVFNIGA